MKIALLNEDSQAEKNSLIYQTLVTKAGEKGHIVYNYGMLSEDDPHEINFTQIGIIASILIETKAVDFIVTGCGTGQGAMVSCNAFSNLVCGYIATPLDAYLFTQVNAGNVVSLPFAQYFGWGAEINLSYIFEKLFAQDFGQGYPAIFAEGEKRSRINMMEKVKQPAQYGVLEALQRMDQTYLKTLLDYKEFKVLFHQHAKDCEITSFIKNLLNE